MLCRFPCPQAHVVVGISSSRPPHRNTALLLRFPVIHPVRVCAHDFAHPLSLGEEGGMAENTTDVSSDFDVPHIEQNQAVRRMTEPALEPTFILREQSGAFEAMQQRQQVVIVSAGSG